MEAHFEALNMPVLMAPPDSLGPVSGSGLDSSWPLRDVGASAQTYKVGARFEALIGGRSHGTCFCSSVISSRAAK